MSSTQHSGYGAEHAHPALPPDERSAAVLEECLCAGGLALIPTDTVYGLACNPQSRSAIGRIYELKGRSPLQPSAVMFFSVDAALAALPEIAAAERSALLALLPGPITVLLPSGSERFRYACEPAAALKPAQAGVAHSQSSQHDSGSSDSSSRPLLGLRVPALTAPLKAFGSICEPVLQTSANRSGHADARRIADVPDEIRAGVDLRIDGGELAGRASTVIDLGEYARSGRWRIVREGPIGAAEVQARLIA